MSEFKIVKGMAFFDKKPRRYMKRTKCGITTYHEVKEQERTWATRYGPYGTIKENGGSVTFYNVGQEVEIDVVEELNFFINPNNVMMGYNF